MMMMMSRKAAGSEMMSRSFEAGIDTKSLANLLKLARIQELFSNVGPTEPSHHLPFPTEPGWHSHK
jgi:hypothetical protein